MNITLTVQADSAPELATAIQSLAAAYGAPQEVTGTPDVTVIPAPKVRAPKKAPELKPADPEPPTDAPAATETPAEDGSPKLDLQTIREAAMRKRDQGKREEIKALLEEFGVIQVIDLKKDKYPVFLEKLNAL